MNQQTKGPLHVNIYGQSPNRETLDIGPLGHVDGIATVKKPEDAALLAASYTAFDAAGRELGIDAAELALSIDLAEVIRYALDYALLNSERHKANYVGRPDQVQAARGSLAKVAELMQVKLPL
jgi:hypothetical protein